MNRATGYEDVLRAIGNVLDRKGIGSVSIREEDDGLRVEGRDRDSGAPVTLRYGIADIHDLLVEADNRAFAERVRSTLYESVPVPAGAETALPDLLTAREAALVVN